jgi:hypothetical protein
VLRYIGDGKKYYGFVSETYHGSQVEMEFLTPAPGEALARWYMMFGDSARIIEPDSFRQQVKELTEKTKANLTA